MIKEGLKNGFWSVLDTVLYIVLYLAALPVLLNSLGKSTFGLWIFLNTLMGILGLLQLNTGAATTRNVSYYSAQSNYPEVTRTINNALGITLIGGLAILIISAIIAGIEMQTSVFGIRDSYPGQYVTCFMLAGVTAALRGFYPVFQGAFKACNKFATSAVLNILSKGGLLAVNIGLALSGYGLLHILWANIIISLLFLIIQFIYVGRYLPYYKISIQQLVKIERPAIAYSFWPWLQSLFVMIAFQTDRFWVTSFSGLSEVSSYGLASTLFNHIHLIFLSLIFWVFPGFSATAANGHSSEQLYKKASGLLSGIAISLLLLFYFISPFVLEQWLGADMQASAGIYLKAYTLFELIFIYTILPFYYLNAIGKGKLAAWCTAGYCLLSYVFMIITLVFTHDAVYMVYAMTLSLCISMPLLQLVVDRHVSGTYRPFIILRQVAVTYLAIAFLLVPDLAARVVIGFVMAALFYSNYLMQERKEAQINPPENI
ncbi:MAG: hypothetical protein EOP56_10770 [Sphingobacteriales bacterium]|nr:MAG: hypothetical protein EOP56_10770 [Sphingobacteriales bacterium]